MIKRIILRIFDLLEPIVRRIVWRNLRPVVAIAMMILAGCAALDIIVPVETCTGQWVTREHADGRVERFCETRE